MEILDAVPGVRLVAGTMMGLALGRTVRRALERNGLPLWAKVERGASPVLAVVSAIVALRLVPENGMNSPPNNTLLLSIYCLGTAAGFLSTHISSIPRRSVIVGLDVSVFCVLACMFILLVLGNARVSLSELPVSQWVRLAAAAGSLGLLVALIQHCGLTGEWMDNLLNLLSVFALAALEIPHWFDVMRRGFVYMDVPAAFAYGIQLILTYLGVWPMALALGILGMVVAQRRASYDAIIACVAQFALLGLVLFSFLLPN